MSVDATSSSQTSQESIAAGATYILNNNDLLERVVKRLGPDRILQPYEPGKGEQNGLKALFFGIQRDWNATKAEDRTPEVALRFLKNAIFVDRPRYTEILLATCTANNPELAQEILATWMDEAVKWHIEKYDDSKAYDEAHRFYDESVQKLDAAQRALREFLLRKADVPEFDPEKRRLQVELAEVAGRQSTLHETIRTKEESIAQLKAKLDGPNALPPTIMRKVRQSSTSSEAVTSLEGQIVTALIDLTRLRQNLANPNDSELLAKERQLKAMREALETMKAELRSAPMVDEAVDNPLLKKAQDDVLTLEGDLITDRARLVQVNEAFTDKTTKLRRLLELEPEYEKLLGAALQAETTNKAAQINWNIAQQKRLLGAGNFSSLRDVQKASLPLDKEGPNRGKVILGAFLVGLFFGLGVLVLRTLPDDVVRTRDDLERIEGLAVIGVMPRLDGKNLRRHTALREQGW